MAYTEAMKCLIVDTSKNKNALREDRIHGGLLLLNELLRVSDVKFEVRFKLGCFLERVNIIYSIYLEYLSRFNSSI
jgi:hypothetical protein